MWSYIFCPHPNWTCVTNSIEEQLRSVAHFVPELATGSYREQREANLGWNLGWQSDTAPK